MRTVLVGLFLLSFLAISSLAQDPEYIDSRVGLRLRKRANVSLLDEDNEASRPVEDDNRYHYRLRVGAEGRWESGLKLGGTIQSQGLWDDRGEGDRSEPGISEAYLGLENIGFWPVSAQIGRQSLTLGRGLLLSDYEKDWSFDSIEAEYDAFPYTWGFLIGRTSHLSPETDLEWLGVLRSKYEPESPFIRSGEFYGGGIRSYSGENFGVGGTRLELAFSPETEWWAETATENGNAPSGDRVSSWIADTGFTYTLHPRPEEWSFTVRGTYASGGGGEAERDFVPLMDREIGGVVLRPELSNIQVYQCALKSPLPCDASLELDCFQYRRNEAESGVVGKNGWMHEGLKLPARSDSRDLGWEANVTCEVKLREHLHVRLIAGLFRFGSAFQQTSDDEVVEGWIEMDWRY